MKQIILAVLGITAAHAQTLPLNTQGVGVDRNGVCWIQGPANSLVQVAPKLGTPVAVTSATQVLPKGVWIVVSSTGTATVVTSDGTTQAGIASGSAYPV